MLKFAKMAVALAIAAPPLALAPAGFAQDNPPPAQDEAAAAEELDGNPFAAAEYPDALRYRACIAEVRERPEVALKAAALWRDNEGGVPAKHCTAIALLALDRVEEAAAWLDEAAEDVADGQGLHARGAVGGRALVAELKAQAGNAWMLAADYERALAAFSDAIARLPAATVAVAELLVDRARAAAGLGDYGRAISDLDRVIERMPERIDAYVLRATAHRYMQSLDAAELDLMRALAIDPDDAEALFERGIVRRLSGDDHGAREDWERVAKLHPGTETAELALDNLELMREED